MICHASRALCLSALLLASVFCAQGALADTITVSLFGTDTVTGETTGFEQTFSPADDELVIGPDGDFTLNVPERPANNVWQLNNLSASGEFDPQVNLNFAVTNVAPNPTSFVMIVTLPVAPALAAPTIMGGSASFTATDSNFAAGASLSTTGADPLFLGTIDGSGVLPLFASPFTLTTPAGSISDFQVAGLPGPTLPGPAVNASIGITLRFTLSANDSASGTTSFIVEIPEPTGLLLLASLLVPVTLATRRA